MLLFTIRTINLQRRYVIRDRRDSRGENSTGKSYKKVCEKISYASPLKKLHGKNDKNIDNL